VRLRQRDPGAGRAARSGRVREVLEETGIHAVVQGLAAVSSGPEAVRYENGDLAQYLALTFLCRAVGAGDPRVADEESTAVGWFEANALPEPLMRSSQARIARAGLPRTP
jgi:ADP-ribose pyrophosphatase YjhB (NUDIX family)